MNFVSFNACLGQRQGVKSELLFLAALVAPILGHAGEQTKTKPTVAALSWLGGTWIYEKEGRTVTERWTSPAGGMMLGTSHTIAKEKTIEYEFVVIRADADGDVFYVAKPSGQLEAAFKLIRVTPHEAVFENTEHDFPQRILYTLKDSETLLAAIEGVKGGKSRRIEFPYRRAK
jgi:hypothetical protein